jgi:hypothetical protein
MSLRLVSVATSAKFTPSFEFVVCASDEEKERASKQSKDQSKIEAQGMRYIIAPAGVGAGDIISSRSDAPIKPGMTKRMKDMPTGTTMHNVELSPGKGAIMCRAAGTSATLIKNGEDGLSLIALPSGAIFFFFFELLFRGFVQCS